MCPGSRLNFFTGGLYFLVGKVGDIKNEIGVQEFKTPILIQFHSNETLQCFFGGGPQVSAIEHASVFSPNALVNGLS